MSANRFFASWPAAWAAASPRQRLGDVGGQAGERKENLIVELRIAGRPHRHRQAGSQRLIGQRPVFAEIAPQRAGTDREHDVVDRRAPRLGERPDFGQREGRGRENPFAGDRFIERRARHVLHVVVEKARVPGEMRGSLDQRPGDAGQRRGRAPAVANEVADRGAGQFDGVGRLDVGIDDRLWQGLSCSASGLESKVTACVAMPAMPSIVL